MPVIPARPATVLALIAALATALCAVMVSSLMIGALHLAPGFILSTLVDALVRPERLEQGAATTVLLDIRLPRVLMAALTGGGLAVAGMMYQALLRNVLADPYILGVSGGASVGALLAIATGFAAVSAFALPASAFAGAMLVAVLVMLAHARPAARDSNALLLSGVMAGAFFSSIILVLITTAGAPLREAVYWLAGSMSSASMSDVMVTAAIALPIVVVATWTSRIYNALVLGSEAAGHLGVQYHRTMLVHHLLASMLTAAVVSFTGLIGFVGFAVPHAIRLLVGTDHRVGIPSSFFVGAIFLVICDLLARTVLHPTELPVGAVTAFVGAPLFIAMISRRR